MKTSRASYRANVARCLMGVAFFVTMPLAAAAAEWPSSLNLSTLNGTTGFRLDGVAANDLSGHAVSSAGDVNGDGFADLIIGAEGAGPNGPGSGSSYVVFGKAGVFASALNLSALNGGNGFRLDGVAVNNGSGFAVSAAGDVNGDGFADLIVGADGAGPNGPGSGSSYVVFGKAGVFASALNLSALNGGNGFRLDGTAAADFSGRAVSSAGDVNGDGFADLIVGAYAADNGGQLSGLSYVVFGKAGGFASAVNLSSLNGATGFRLDGVAAGDRSGRAVSAGDINGDGFADLIVGAFGANSLAGSSYVVFGKASGFASAVNLSSLNGATGFRLDGVTANDRSGYTVSAASDVNGDGFADLIVGAFFADPNGASYAGSSYVVFGKAGGFSSIVNLSTLNGATGFRLDGVEDEDRSGRSVSAAGDVNGDGFADVIVGAPSAAPNGAGSGSSYVVFGKAGGFSSIVNLSTLDGATGFRLNGVAVIDASGFDVAAAGDVNGDGFADLIVGAYHAGPNGNSNAGSSYVIFGRAPDQSVLRAGSRARQTIQGGAFADALVAADAGDVLEGREGGDVLVGGSSTTASYAHSLSGVSASLAAGAINGGDAFGDSYFTIANLEGTALNDQLTGNAKANRLTGGKGKDKLKGGKGNDTFAYRLASESLPASRDEVIDFNPGAASSATDRIDLSAMDAKSGKNGNQAFTFRGTKAFNGAGQIRLKKTSAGIVIQGNTTGNSGAEFEILLKGLTSASKFTAKDFKL